MSRALKFAFAGFVASTMLWALWQVGGPGHNRALRQDEARLSDLRALQWRVTSFTESEGAPPEDMAALSAFCRKQTSYNCSRLDFDLSEYDYTLLDGRDYQLCAEFLLPPPVRRTRGMAYDAPVVIEPVGQGGVFERSDAGRQCFTLTAPKVEPPADKLIEGLMERLPAPDAGE